MQQQQQQSFIHTIQVQGEVKKKKKGNYRKRNDRDYITLFFFRGHGNESCNLIGSLPGRYFPISAQG